MHEWALAEAVVSALLNILQKGEGKRVKKAVVKIGELQQIDKEIFEFALREQVKKTALESFKPILEDVPAVFKCIGCHHKWSFRENTSGLDDDVRESIHFVPELAHAFIRCPKCNSPDFEVAQGRGVWIGEVEIEGDSYGSEK